jgi:hypothetical protein
METPSLGEREREREREVRAPEMNESAERREGTGVEQRVGDAGRA